MGAALRRPPTCPLHYKGWRNPIVVLLAACSIICADVWNSDDDDVIYIYALSKVPNIQSIVLSGAICTRLTTCFRQSQAW